MRVGLVVLILALAGCTGSQSDSDLEVGASILAADRLPPEAEGGWYLIASELPDRFVNGLVGDEVLSVGIVVGDADSPDTAGRLSLGFGCSSFGGGVVSFDPVESTLNSVAGVGGCQERDRAAMALLEQIEGGLVEFRSDRLFVYLDGEAIQLRRSAGVLTSEDEPIEQPLVFDASEVLAALADAKARWAEAPIDDYQIDVAESGNYWMSGCKWTTIVTGGVVVEASVDPSSTSEYCGEVEWTVSKAHEHVARFAGFADGAGPGRLGENKLEVTYNEFAVPATIEFDLANSADEESFVRLTFTSLE